MAGLEGKEDEVNHMLHRIETMLAMRSRAGNTRGDLELFEAELEQRERDLREREAALAEREASVAQRESALARRESLTAITPPPPPVQRATCETCGRNICSRGSVCYDRWGRDIHAHECHACMSRWGQRGQGYGNSRSWDARS